MPIAQDEELILPHYSMIDASLIDRVVAASAGGFARLGVATPVWRNWNDAGMSDAEIRLRLDDAGVRLTQIESIGMPGLPDAAAFWSQVDDVLRMAATFGCDEFFVVGRAGVAFDDHVDMFGRLCDLAAGVGLTVGIEFMPIPTVSAYPDATSALALVNAADRPNSGVVVDTFHHFRGSNDWLQLAAMPGDRVMMIQFNDAAALPIGSGYIDETMHHRMAPGEGALPLVEFVRTMDRIGARGRYAVEVLSSELTTLAPAALGARLGDAARRVIREARSTPDQRPRELT